MPPSPGSFKTAVQLAIHGCPVQGIDYPSIVGTELTGSDLVAFMYEQYVAMAKGSTSLASITAHLKGSEVRNSPHVPEFLKAMGSVGMQGKLTKVGKMRRLHKGKDTFFLVDILGDCMKLY
jgi:hypothetical protein